MKIKKRRTAEMQFEIFFQPRESSIKELEADNLAAEWVAKLIYQQIETNQKAADKTRTAALDTVLL